MTGKWWRRALCSAGVAVLIGLTGRASAQTGEEADRLNAELTSLYQTGKFGEAVPIAQRLLVILEIALGTQHRDVGEPLHNLTILYADQGRYGEAEPLLVRSLAILRTTLGPEHPDVSAALNNLATLYEGLGRYAEGIPLAKESLAIAEKAQGAEHPRVGASLNILAGLYVAQNRTPKAEPLYDRAISILERALGSEHPSVARSLLNLALLLGKQGRYGEAEPFFKRSLALREKVLGPEHPHVADSLDKLATLALRKNDLTAAVDRWHRATTLLQRRAERGLGGSTEGSSKGEVQKNSWYFEGLVKTKPRLVAERGGDTRQSAADMFETVQWGGGSEAAVALGQTAARSAGVWPEFAVLVRERQDLVAKWQGKDKLLIAAKSEQPDKRNTASGKALRDRLAAIDSRLAAIDVRFATDFPEYAAFASPKPISVADVQGQLRNDEALVLFLDTNAGFKPLPEETFVWVVTKTDVRWVRSELGTAALNRKVATLRCGLDATAWHGDGTSKCADLLKLAPDQVPKDGQALPFDAARAHTLYKSLVGEAADLIKGKHLLVVPSGALTTLPFQVLVTDPPRRDRRHNGISRQAMRLSVGCST